MQSSQSDCDAHGLMIGPTIGYVCPYYPPPTRPPTPADRTYVHMCDPAAVWIRYALVCTVHCHMPFGRTTSRTETREQASPEPLSDAKSSQVAISFFDLNCPMSCRHAQRLRLTCLPYVDSNRPGERGETAIRPDTALGSALAADLSRYGRARERAHC